MRLIFIVLEFIFRVMSFILEEEYVEENFKVK